MNCRVLITAAFLLVAPASAETPQATRADFEAALTALAETPPLICPSGMVSAMEMRKRDPAATEAMAAKAVKTLTEFEGKPSYMIPFDTTAGEEISRMIRTALATAASPGLDADYAKMNAATALEGYSKALGDVGLSAESVIDVTAVYLAFVWAAQEGDFSVVQTEGGITNIRDQLAIAESRCFQLGAIGDDLPRIRNLMIARSGFLIDGLEAVSTGGETAAFGDYIRNTSGRYIKGLKLTPDGFDKAE
jgi:hypothetical protein